METGETLSQTGKRLLDYVAIVSGLLIEDIPLLESLPEDFVLVTLPREEPDLVQHALTVMPQAPEKPVVYALVSTDNVMFLLPQGPVRAELAAA